MPDLIDSLLKQNIGHLRIVAEFWGLELDSADADSAREELAASLLDFDLLAELLESLPPQADSALTELADSDGRIAWQAFARKYGDIREMGAAKRDRERPYLLPASTAEILFYRGLLARAFFETDQGSQEFAYIPEDIFILLNREERKEESDALSPSKGRKKDEPLGRPASPGEKGREILADDSILDDATTLLAALRMGKSIESPSLPASSHEQASRLQSLLETANLIKNDGIQTEAAKTFLEASRADALRTLHEAWLESTTFNELKLMPGIVCEGEWKNQPQETREFLLNLLGAIPEGKWWSLNALVRDIKAKYADFQRPAGDYDSWFIKRASEEQYLRGFDSWNEVDGALIRFFINILHWLGRLDLSIAGGATEPTAFRVSSFEKRTVESGKITASSNGKISIPRNAPRVIRYQLARFCEWDEPKNDEFKYRVTAQSLKHAKEQGLKAEQLLSLLVKHTENKAPPPLVQALKRWDANGTEARVETQTVLRVSQPEVLEEMRKSKAGKFLGEILSPTAVIVKRGAIQNVMDALAELGLLAEAIE
jgi:hypothetical protein